MFYMNRQMPMIEIDATLVKSGGTACNYFDLECLLD